MKKVLIADDQLDTIRILESNLKAAGYAVVSVRDGNECLQKIYTEKPDLVILDIFMPKLDGNEVAVKLKSDPRFKTLPIIFLTALRSKEDEENEGACVAQNTIFAKPFNSNKILDKIRELIGT